MNSEKRYSLKLYRNFTSQDEIDQEYNAVLRISDLQPYIEHDENANIEARNELKSILGIQYGPSPDETIDIFPAKNPFAPVFVFIHGGYWQSMNSQDFSMVARGLVSNGFTVAIPNYSLCPSVSISEITIQNRAAIAWIFKEINKYNGNPNQMFVCGHSAGGQQVGMLASTDWKKDYNLPENIIKGGIPISGIFDLSPLYYSWLQPTIQLTHGMVHEQSPLFQIPDNGFPMLVSVGETESPEFKRQSQQYFLAWQKKGFKGTMIIQPDKNHFTAIRDFSIPSGPFTASVLEFMKDCLEEVV